jgi:tetratricopeptide (TPR) repeat protein
MTARPRALLAALASRAAGQSDQADRLFEEARRVLEREVRAHPDDPRYHSSLGIAYAGLGQSEAAVREGEAAVALLPLSKDAVYGIPYRIDLATIHAMVGDEDAALSEIEHLLTVPNWISPTFLKIDPRFDPLSESPRFQVLLEEYEQ